MGGQTLVREGMKDFVFTEDNFSSAAKALRQEFEAKMGNPKNTHSGRFVWDFWHVPHQYTLLRTPADHFFSVTVWDKFLKELGLWSARNLGCQATTPPWLSCYIEGCEQKLHSDVPHGPWAFVFSLSPKKSFKGGETLLLRPQVLDYWKNFIDAEDRELHSFVKEVPSPFNRLTVFDSRIPHGVNRVSGTMDPMEGRLVIHGWFTEPKPYLEGALSASKVAAPLDEAVENFSRAAQSFGAWHGMLSLRLRVSPAGKVQGVKVLANSLQPLEESGPLPFRIVREQFGGLKLPKAKGSTEITIPLLFR